MQIASFFIGVNKLENYKIGEFMLNKICLTGRITKDPELKKTQNNHSVVNFTIGVERIFKETNGQRLTDFFQCVAWKHNADFLDQYIRKGDFISLSGRLQNNKWTKEDGKKVEISEIQVESVQLIRTKNKGDQYVKR